jgi:hypothetical protein
MDKNERARVIYRAEQMERASKSKGKRCGMFGATGLDVLRSLLFKFGDRPMPSYRAIRRVTGLCNETISKALKNLKAAGLMEVQRRTRPTLLGSRRITNAYAFPRQISLPLLGREQKTSVESSKIASSVPEKPLAGSLLDALNGLGGRFGRQLTG